MNKITDIIDNLKYNEHEILIKKNPRVFTISDNNKQLKLEFLGKGGEGIVYKYDNYAIKFYKNIIVFNKDLFITRLTNRLANDKITNNFLTLYGYTQVFQKDVMIINLIDGNLENWILSKHTDDEWLNMIFQMLYAVLTMQQCLKMYHADMKPKNLLFKKINPSIFEYNIKTNNKTYAYKTKTNYIFMISDFGHSSSLLFPKQEYNENNISNDEINKLINKNKDLEHLASFHKRLIVTMINNTYSLDELVRIGNNNEDFNKYMANAKKEIEKDMHSYNDKVKSHMLFRSLAYYLLENDYIDIKSLQQKSKNKIHLPSKNIINILNSLSNLNGTTELLQKINEIGEKLEIGVNNKINCNEIFSLTINF